MSDSPAASVALPAPVESLASDLQSCSLEEPLSKSAQFMVEHYGEYGIDAALCKALGKTGGGVISGSLAMHAVMKAFDLNPAWRPSNVNILSWGTGEELQKWLESECTPLLKMQCVSPKYATTSRTGHFFDGQFWGKHKKIGTHYEIVLFDPLYDRYCKMHQYLELQGDYDFLGERNYFDGDQLHCINFSVDTANLIELSERVFVGPFHNWDEIHQLIDRMSMYSHRGFRFSNIDIDALLATQPTHTCWWNELQAIKVRSQQS